MLFYTNIDKEINMVASIQTNNQLVVPSSPIQTYNQDVQESSGFTEIYTEQLPKADAFAQTQYSSRISNIKQSDIEALYQVLKKEVKEELDTLNIESKKLESFDYLNGNIDKIMSASVEVKIERDEIYLAIIYGRLGINYLEVKKIEVKIELLGLAKNEVIQQREEGLITEKQAQVLYDKIEINLVRLGEQKQRLLKGNNVNQDEELFLEQLTKQKNFNL